MNNPYLDLIAQERAKISVLRTRIAEIEGRISLLESLVPDEFDDALTRAMVDARAKAAAVKESQDFSRSHDAYQERLQIPVSEEVPQSMRAGNGADEVGQQALPVDLSQQYRAPGRRLPPSTLKLLAYLGQAPRSRDEMLQFLEGVGAPSNLGALSTFVYGYKKHFGFVDTDREGNTLLTERGASYVREHFAEIETPASAVTDAGVDSQQAGRLPESEGTDPEGGY